MSFLSTKQKQQISSALQLQNVAKRQQKTPRRSRSVSRSRSRSRPKKRTLSTVAQKNNKRNNKQLTAMVRAQMLKHAPVVKALAEKKKTLEAAKLGYFTDSKDVKNDIPALNKEIDQIQRELDMARAMLEGGLGNRPIKLRMSAPISVITTVTTGVTDIFINAVTRNLDPQYCTEWTTAAALFGQYRCMGGEFSFIYKNFVNSSIVALPYTGNSIPVIAYDPDDNTAPASSIALTTAAQHKILTPLILGTAEVSGPLHHTFKWHTPRGPAATTASQTPEAGTEWIPVNGVVPAGFVKFYHIGAGVTALTTGAGYCYFDLEFRCRE